MLHKAVAGGIPPGAGLYDELIETRAAQSHIGAPGLLVQIADFLHIAQQVVPFGLEDAVLGGRVVVVAQHREELRHIHGQALVPEGAHHADEHVHFLGDGRGLGRLGLGCSAGNSGVLPIGFRRSGGSGRRRRAPVGLLARRGLIVLRLWSRSGLCCGTGRSLGDFLLRGIFFLFFLALGLGSLFFGLVRFVRPGRFIRFIRGVRLGRSFNAGLARHQQRHLGGCGMGDCETAQRHKQPQAGRKRPKKYAGREEKGA